MFHLGNAQTVGNQFRGIEADLIFARGAAEACHVDNIGDGFKIFLNRPILDRFQVHHIVLRIGAFQREEIDLPDRAPVRSHLRDHARRQGDLRQPLENPLAIPRVFLFIIEN